MKRITRRELAALAGAGAVTAQAQTPPAVPSADLRAAVRDANRRASDTLAKFEIPVATEPAFQFKA